MLVAWNVTVCPSLGELLDQVKLQAKVCPETLKVRVWVFTELAESRTVTVRVNLPVLLNR